MKTGWVYLSKEAAGYDDDGYAHTVSLFDAKLDPFRKLADYPSSHTPEQLTGDLKKAGILR